MKIFFVYQKNSNLRDFTVSRKTNRKFGRQAENSNLRAFTASRKTSRKFGKASRLRQKLRLRGLLSMIRMHHWTLTQRVR